MDTKSDEQLLEEAIDLIAKEGRASTSFLQKRFRIGYGRASRIMDLLEDKGIIGPINGSLPREILIETEAPKEIKVVETLNELRPEGDFQVGDLEFKSKYVYNKEDDQYVFLLQKQIGKNLVLHGERVRSIIRGYSNFDGDQLSINDIALRYDIPRNIVVFILKALELTHSSLPVSNEELLEKEEEELVDEILQNKRFNINQQLNKKDWEITKQESDNWRQFRSNVLNPFVDYLDDFSVEPLKEIPYQEPHNYSEDELVIGISDLQIGSYAEKDYVTFGDGDWDTGIAVKLIKDYADKFVARATQKGIRKVTILALGDIGHGLFGETAKGTKLKCDKFEEKQFDAILEALKYLCSLCLSNFKKVDLRSVYGNHLGRFHNYIVFRMLQEMFSKNDRILIDVSLKHTIHFKVKDTLIIATHGASPEIKFQVPNDAKGRTALGQRLIRNAEKEGGYKDIKRVIFCQGDKHHHECIELGQFTFIMFSTPVKSDEYADQMMLENTPSQQALVIGENADYEIINIAL